MVNVAAAAGTKVFEPARAALFAGLVTGLIEVRHHAVLDHPDAQAERLVDGAVPDSVAPGEVVVHGDQVGAAPRQGVQIEWRDGRQGLAFARLHLGDLAFVKHHATDQLYFVRLLADFAPGHLAGDGERFGEQVVEVLALREARPELAGLGKKRLIAERGRLIFQRQHLVADLVEPFDLFLV